VESIDFHRILGALPLDC